MTHTLLRLLLLLCLILPAQARTLTGRVVAVSDGDTLTLLAGSKQYKIRLAQIDAPEKKQPFGQRSRQSLAELAYGRTVDAEVATEDKYGRLVATIRIEGQNINQEQIRRGMAWVYVHYPHSADMLASERQARSERRGLWSQANPVPPWDWRRQQKTGNDWEWLLQLLSSQQAQAAKSDAPGLAYRCGDKLSCKQMRSCEEARFHLQQCGVTRLDGNGDGIPCEALCR